MALNLGNVDNNLGGLKLNPRIDSNKKSFSSNSVAAIKKKKNDFNIPIIKDLTTSKSDLPEIPQSKVVKVNSSEKKSFSDLPKINTSNSKNNEKINLPDIKQTVSSNAINKDYKGTSASFGDLVEGTAKTIANAGVNLGTGILKYGEQAMDSMIQFGSSKYNPYYIFNPDKLESHQQIAKELIEKDATTKVKDILGYNKKLSSGKTVEEELEQDSLIKHDNLAGQVAQSIGQMLPSMMMGQGVTGSEKLKEAVSLGGMSIASFGGGVETAYNNGGSREDATKYGLLNSAIETASEKAFAGIGGVFGKGALDETITDTITSRINSEIGKKLATIGISAAGEGTEELISDLFQPIAQKLTYAKEEDLLKLYKDQNYLEDFVSGALSSIGLEAMTLPANNTRVNNFSENNQNQNVNTQEEKVESDNIINSSENNINLKDLQTSNTNTPENINLTLNQPKNNINMQNNDNSNNSKNINYQFSISNNEKINNLRKSASEYFNNSEETQEMIKTFEKIIEDKKYNILFDNKIRNSNKNLVNAQIRTLPNGEIEIKLNPNSNRAGEFLLCHEITHAIETNSMKQLIIDYASKNSEFNQALESLKKTYGTNDVSSEVIADISGQLFGYQEFINDLSMKQPNIFKKIYNKIIEFANKITGNSKESLFIKDLKNKWETAYRNTTTEQAVSNLNKNSKFSIQTDNNGNKYVNVDTNQNIFEGKNLAEQTKIAKQYILDNFRQNGIDVNNENINVTSKTANEYTHPKNQLPVATKVSKMKASTELDNLLSTSEYKYSKSDDGRHPFAKDGWDYYETTFKVGDNLFTGLINIGKSGNKKTLYDITNIKRIDQNRSTSANAFSTSLINSSIGNISQTNDNVKSDTSSTKYSMQKDTNNTQELDNSSFSINNPETYKNYQFSSEDIKEIDNIIRETIRDVNYNGKMESDKLDEWINEIPIIKQLNEEDIDIDDYQYNILQNIENKIYDGLEKEGISLRYDEKKDENTLDRQELAIKGYNEMLDFFDEKHINYEISRSAEAGYVPSIYIKDSDGDVIYRVSNHNNGYVDDFDMVYNDAYNTLFEDKDYANWKERIIPEIKKTIGNIYNLDNSFSSYSQQNDEWQEHLEKNYKATGTRTKLNDQKILPPINKTSENIKKAMIPIREDLKEVNSLNKELKKEIKELKTEINKINTAVESNNKKINLPDKNYYKDQMKIYSEIDYNSLSADGKKLYNEFMNKAKTELNIPMDPTKETSYNSKEEIKKIDAKKSRIEVSKKYREQAKEFVKDTELWKDKQNLWKYKVNTMKRNLRDIMDVKQANAIYSEYFEPISENNAKIEKEIEKYNEKIRKLNLNNKESVAVQMFGEYKYNPETMVTWRQIHEYMENNHLDHNKIENAIEVFRNTYDDLYQRVNNKLAEQGYSTIEYKKGYFPHFKKTHGTTVLTKFAEKLGWKTNDQQLPTDVAGLTENFLPGKRWTSFSQHREGKITDYDALQGFDNYIRGAMDIIYHTEDIQKLRAFENEIRYQHSEKGIQEKIDAIDNNSLLYEEEKIKQKEQVFKEANNPLPNFVTELRDYTNNLANKKSSLDRSTEQFFGRKIYNTMTNVQNRVSANMVGLNISSALTNFIPITQAWSQVKTKNLAQAIKLSVMDNIYSDNFSEKSVYLTNRTKQADRLSKTKLENITDKAGFLFEKIDEFTSNVIVRGKYLENIENGMSETQAIKNADEFAKDVMAGRSKGDMPTIFNAKNPIVKTFTAFQLEVNNQYGYMFKDLPNDLRDKGLNKLIGAFFKMFIGAWIYNKISDKVTGRKSAFSPIDTLSEIVSTSSNDKLSSYDKLKNSIENVAQDVPFIGGLLGGGRLPISAAIPDVGTTAESVTNLFDEDKRDSAIANLTKELSKPFFYVAMPLGGGQAKKTIEGLSMYSSDKDIKGSYTASGKLRFPVSEDLGSKVQAAIFGQYANENAKEYFDNNRSPLTEKQQEEFKKLNIPISKYWSYRDDLKEINKIESDKDEDGKTIKGSANGKKAYQIMNNDNYSKDEKQYLLDSITSTENKVKIEDLKTIGNNEEVYKYYYSLNNDGKTEMLNAIKKYNFTGKQLLDFSNVNKNETKNAKENIINYLIKSDLTDEQKNYLYSKNYSDTSTIINSKIPMNSYLNLQLKINNYSSSGNKKNYVMQEIASLPGLNPTQKILLTYFSGYSIGNNDYKGFSSDSARKAAFDYIDNLNISLAEKRTICEKAGFKVYTNGKIGW